MTLSAFLSVSPAEKKNKSREIAKAVEVLEEDFELEYEVTPMGTLIETRDISELFDAVQAAHESVESDRVSTFLKIDDKRNTDEPMEEKLSSLRDHLNRR
ncbi:MAG: MTH1187 family thiamine-binding protein [Halobacteria archaeon]